MAEQDAPTWTDLSDLVRTRRKELGLSYERLGHRAVDPVSGTKVPGSWFHRLATGEKVRVPNLERPPTTGTGPVDVLHHEQRALLVVVGRLRREPLRPVGALLIVALLLGLGAGARWLWADDEPAPGTAPAASASPTPADRDTGRPPTPSSTPTTPAPSSSVDISDAEAVAKEAVRRYLTRNPPEDGTHKAAVRRAAPLMTASLVENLLRHDDPAFDKLVSRGGVSSVSEVTTEPAGGDLPPDTPLRIWRTTTARIDVAGYTDYRETTVLQIEVTRDGDRWRVSRILGL